MWNGTWILASSSSPNYSEYYDIPFAKWRSFNSSFFTSLTNLSFISSTVKEWNKFYTAIRKLDSLSKFKNALCLNSQLNKISVAKLYYYGPRKKNVILAQPRCRASVLNHDIFKVNILSRPVCSWQRTSRRCKPLLFCFYQIFWNEKRYVSQHKQFIPIDEYFPTPTRKWNFNLCRLLLYFLFSFTIHIKV